MKLWEAASFGEGQDWKWSSRRSQKKKISCGLVWTLPRNSSLTRIFNVKGNVHNCKAILPARSAVSHAEKPVYKRENIGEMDVYWRFVCMIPKILWKQN